MSVIQLWEATKNAGCPCSKSSSCGNHLGGMGVPVVILMHPDSKSHGANMGSTWVLSARGGPHVGPMNIAIRAVIPLLHLPHLKFGLANKFLPQIWLRYWINTDQFCALLLSIQYRLWALFTLLWWKWGSWNWNLGSKFVRRPYLFMVRSWYFSFHTDIHTHVAQRAWQTASLLFMHVYDPVNALVSLTSTTITEVSALETV